MAVKKATKKAAAKKKTPAERMAEMQERGETDVKKILVEHDLGLGSLGGADFERAMDRILIAVTAAWTAGFVAGSGD